MSADEYEAWREFEQQADEQYADKCGDCEEWYDIRDGHACKPIAEPGRAAEASAWLPTPTAPPRPLPTA